MTTDPHFLDWTQREKLAERMVPLIGTLYREHNIIVTIYGKPLHHRTPVSLIKAHKYARKFDGKTAINMAESTAVLQRLTELHLPPARIDVAKLVRSARASNLDVIEYVDAAVASLKTETANAREPSDVVLYGFGRIGRLLARMLVNKVGGGQKARLRAIVVRPKGGADLARRASLLRRDSVHGPFQGSIDLDRENNELIINGNRVKLLYASSPSDIDYTAHGINDALVIDNTGKWRDRDGLEQHLRAPGASRVLLTAPGKGDIPNIVFGVNSAALPAGESVVSAASCTTNAVVPALAVLDNKYGIVSGHIESVHSFTNDQNLTDNYHPKARRSRSASMNMVITTTGAATAAAKALPSLAGKLTASAIRVPTPNVSLAILNLNLAQATDREALNECLRRASMGGPLQDQIDWTAAPDVVSIDLVGNDHACIIDATATIVEGTKAVVYAWYDNEYGYSAQCIRLMAQMIGIRRPSIP
ncbi:MAG: glyceraldehyde-3-phosphate dehydrogenase [Myxococcota bacterium]|nr:glyceraldehyde-3-phosphate dehydrogenase [Myxococcota bacterium]